MGAGLDVGRLLQSKRLKSVRAIKHFADRFVRPTKKMVWRDVFDSRMLDMNYCAAAHSQGD